MKPASLMTHRRYTSRPLPVSLPALLAILLLLLPAVVLFCYNWSSSAATVQAVPQQSLALTPRVGIVAGSGALAVPPLANPRFVETIYPSGSDPFPSVSRDMLTAATDPFLYALASGAGEGRLIQTGSDGRIPVYGPPIPRLRYRSDADILHMLSSGVGGTFQNFFSNVFGESGTSANSSDAPADSDENPFRRARESSATEAASDGARETADAGDGNTDAPAESSSSEQSGQQADAAPKPASSGSVDVWRPGLLMRVGEQGALESIPVSHPSENVLESADFGLRDFDLLTLPEPSEFPVSVAVADFNADGRADAAVQTAYEGVVRLFLAAPEGGFEEQLRVKVGSGRRSITAADFNSDGLMDLALSNIGTGTLTMLFGGPDNQFSFRSWWIDIPRNYIASARDARTGAMQLLGMNFEGSGVVLLDFAAPAGVVSGASSNAVRPALSRALRTAGSWWPNLSAVVLNSGLALNLDNRSGLFSNIVNVAPGSDAYLVAGDLDLDGSLVVAVARKR